MRIGATIQARMGSTRLPEKVLKHIVGKPMLELQIERILQSRLIDEVIIATSIEPQDEAIERLAHSIGVSCFRGSENNVLSRIVGALKAFEVDINVEFMGDNPIPDPLLIDSIVGFYLKHADRYDYVTNALKTTYPPGAEVYVYPSAILYDAESRVTDPSLREHVGLHIYQHPERYRICNIEAPAWFQYPDFYLEVDTQKDFEVISKIYEHFYPHNPGFGLLQIIDFMKATPELAAHNQGIERRWKVYRQNDA
ncbi:cytidylyltransferase domain-containing protein [Thermodesulfobacteriota bacterium]